MNQILIACFGLTAMFCATGNNPTLRRYAPIIGLCGQPAWAWFAWQTQAWGLAVICVAYTLVYIQGIRVQWGKA